MVDAHNMCWFHECVQGEYGLHPMPVRCALGSKISYNFIAGAFNPCTFNFDDVIGKNQTPSFNCSFEGEVTDESIVAHTGYNCTRAQKSVDGPPPCHDDTQCENGGTPTYEADRCWCLCTSEWTSDKCELPVQDVAYMKPGSDICVDGAPLEDWCASSPCLNGGECYNQCNTFWCDCPDHFNNDYYGKRCELPPTETKHEDAKSEEEVTESSESEGTESGDGYAKSGDEVTESSEGEGTESGDGYTGSGDEVTESSEDEGTESGDGYAKSGDEGEAEKEEMASYK